MVSYPRLSKREKEVLEALLGSEEKAVAEKLGVTPDVIYTYKARVRAKIRQAKNFLKAMNRYARVLETVDFKLSSRPELEEEEEY